MGRNVETGLIVTSSLLGFFIFVSFLFYIQNSAFQSQVRMLQSQNQQLESEVNQKDQAIYYLENQIDSLERQVEGLQDWIDLYEQVPSNYYETNIFPNRPNRAEELEYFLDYELRIPTNLREMGFDCSEWSACLEWVLEDAGFDARIVCGPTPWGGSGYHAWLLVYAEDYRVAVEATGPHIVYSNDEFGDEYYHGYDESFRNVYLAIKDDRAVREWDWWVSGWGVLWPIG